jgi:hypothetical protein
MTSALDRMQIFSELDADLQKREERLRCERAEFERNSQTRANELLAGC